MQDKNTVEQKSNDVQSNPAPQPQPTSSLFGSSQSFRSNTEEQKSNNVESNPALSNPLPQPDFSFFGRLQSFGPNTRLSNVMTSDQPKSFSGGPFKAPEASQGSSFGQTPPGPNPSKSPPKPTGTPFGAPTQPGLFGAPAPNQAPSGFGNGPIMGRSQPMPAFGGAKFFSSPPQNQAQPAVPFFGNPPQNQDGFGAAARLPSFFAAAKPPFGFPQPPPAHRGFPFPNLPLPKDNPDADRNFIARPNFFGIDMSAEEVQFQHRFNKGRTVVKPYVDLLGEMLIDCDYSRDVTFIVGASRVPIKAHKVILAAHSNVFKNMLYSGHTRGSLEPSVELPDIEPSAMQKFIDYCYLLQVPSVKDGDDKAISIEDAFEVMHIADKYRVTPLINKMKDSILQGTTEANVVKVITLASQLPYCKEIEDHAIIRMIGSDAINKENSLNDFPVKLVGKICEKAEHSTFTVLILSRVVEYLENNPNGHYPGVTSLLVRIVQEKGITQFPAKILKYCMNHDLIPMEEVLDKLMRLHNPAPPQAQYNRFALRVYADDKGKPKVEMMEKYEVPKVEIGQPNKRVRYWGVTTQNAKLIRMDYENLLLNHLCVQHERIHYVCSIFKPQMTESFEGTLIVEEEHDGKFIFDRIEEKRGVCCKESYQF
eukprot:TRINITY_DN88614_c1_g1_i1.p1 TRINITY_DN88614_c1_g1~~TRINITY_DN88614_c1_g1_i1.p1  ORF type:complete len:705 (+),score=34.76 TRINITY_DN88614_c1_g1_i1:166-2115(+)